jgi:hypothetical protein
MRATAAETVAEWGPGSPEAGGGAAGRAGGTAGDDASRRAGRPASLQPGAVSRVGNDPPKIRSHARNPSRTPPAHEAETAAAHRVMELVRNNPSLSHHVHRLRNDVARPLAWRQVLAELTRIQLQGKGRDR